MLEILWQLILSMRINLGIIIKNNTYFWYSCDYQSDKGAQDYFCIIFILGIFHPVLFIFFSCSVYSIIHSILTANRWSYVPLCPEKSQFMPFSMIVFKSIAFILKSNQFEKKKKLSVWMKNYMVFFYFQKLRQIKGD